MVTLGHFSQKNPLCRICNAFFLSPSGKKNPKKRKKICLGEVIFRIGPLKHKAWFGHQKSSSHICKTKHESWTFMKLLTSPTCSTYLTPICILKPKHHLDILNVDFEEKIPTFKTH
jgi:hypothetical protein